MENACDDEVHLQAKTLGHAALLGFFRASDRVKRSYSVDDR